MEPERPPAPAEVDVPAPRRPAAARSPLVLTGALCTGLAAAIWIRPGAAAGIAALLLAGTSVMCAARRPSIGAGMLAAALVAVGVWWGGERLALVDASALVAAAGETRPSLVEVTGPVRRGQFEQRAPVRVLRFGGLAAREPAQLELPARVAPPPQGARLEMIARARLPDGPRETAGGAAFDERAYLARRGAHVVLEAASYRVVGARGGVGGVADRVRAVLRPRIAPGLDGERGALVRGVVLGEDEGLARELQDRFRSSGLYHLLAVSGQNVAYLVAGVLLLGWLLGVPRWLAQVAALLAIAGYVAAVGWQPSVVRAGVAGALACLAWIASRPSDRWAMLLVGAAVLLAWNPYALLEPGFQLSFAAVGAIFVLVPRLERRLAGLPLTARVGPVLAVAACCGIVTAPIVWLHFGSVSVVSVPANAVAEPVVAPILALGLGAAALEPVLPDAAATLGWANGWLVAYLAWCARAFGGLGFSTVSSPAAVGGTLAGVVVLVLAVRFRRVLARGRRRVRAPALIGMGCVAVVGAVVASLHPGGSDRGPPAGLRLTFLDVGQGDSVLLETRAGAVLVDQGPPEARVARRLHALGVERLAAVVLTHPELDHIGGAPEVVERLRVGTVLDPGQPLGSPERDRAIRDARAQGIPVVLARAGATYVLGELELRVLWPEDGGRAGEDPNSHAVVLHARYGEIDALLTADAESDVLSRVRLPTAEILKVAHHGSEDPGLGAILRTVRPRVAVVSVGADNDYGHPAPTTLAALAAVPELDVYRTDLDGDVEVETDGAAVTVTRSR